MERDPSNGMLIGPDGCHYTTEREAYHFAVLKLCGCGNPEGAYNFCREVLTAFDRREKPWINAQEVITKIVAADPELAGHVIAHLFDHLGLLEHGTNIGGSWLTELGATIVDAGAITEEEYDH